MKKSIFCLFFSLFLASEIYSGQTALDQAKEALNGIKKHQPEFVVSVGTSESQTHTCGNTVQSEHMGLNLRNIAFNNQNPVQFLLHKDHIGYFLTSIQHFYCPQCQKSITQNLNIYDDYEHIAKLAEQVINESKHNFSFQLSQCPTCSTRLETKKHDFVWTAQHQQALIDQIQYVSPQNCTAPSCRMSVEMSAVLNEKNEIDQTLLQEQVNFIKALKNPLLFCHHYANPASNPDLFATEEESSKFADYVVTLIQTCKNNGTNISHLCPISQPVAFCQRVTRATLPPFTSDTTSANLLKNMAHAQLEICKQAKKIDPNIKILMSHQWKLFKPIHQSWFSLPKYTLEMLICNIANRIYNGAFVKMFTPIQDAFDGIALSVYPAMKFDKVFPVGSNCADSFDSKEIFDTIMAMHQAFPTKDIYIVETGCNTNSSDTKEAFIVATLQACKKAIECGVVIKGLYFWGVTNDKNGYYEWNHTPGATHFGPFDELDIKQPLNSINAAGKLLHALNLS